MESNRHLARLISASAAFVLLLTACHGSPSGTSQYLPSGSTSMSAPAGPAISPEHEQRGVIYSSCGHRIHIHVAGIISCRFHELRYHGMFTLHNDTNGLILISPMTGNKHTKFTITGLLVGKGYFTVTDTKGHSVTVHVKVTVL